MIASNNRKEPGMPFLQRLPGFCFISQPAFDLLFYGMSGPMIMCCIVHRYMSMARQPGIIDGHEDLSFTGIPSFLHSIDPEPDISVVLLLLLRNLP